MEPVFGITYSPPKRGKTLAMIRAFPTGLFISLPGGTKCASWLGIKVPQIVAKNLDEVGAIIKRAGTKYPAIIFDDASIQLDSEYQRIKAQDASWSGNDRFNKMVFDLRDRCREAPVHVFWTMHEQPPRDVRAQDKELAKIIPGTVQCPGWQLPEKVPALVDFCARVIHDDMAIGYPRVYSTEPDDTYITGDRLNIAPPRFPLNVGEMLRAAGYEIPRAKGFEWMDKVVEHLAKKFLANSDNLGETAQEEIKRLDLHKKIPNPRHIRWALADAFDRATMRTYNANLLDNYIENLDNATLE